MKPYKSKTQLVALLIFLYKIDYSEQDRPYRNP